MTGKIANDRATNLFTKLSLCLAVLSVCLVVVGGANFVSFNEYFFSYPPKRDEATRLPVTSMPAFSASYFRFYPYSWIVMLIALPWSIYLVARHATTLEQVAIFAACMMLACVVVAASAVIAIYLCNQAFVFKFQHLG